MQQDRNINYYDTNNFKCIRSLSVYLFLIDLLPIVSFFISFAISFIIPVWGQVGWIVPLGFILITPIIVTIVSINGFYCYKKGHWYDENTELPRAISIIDKFLEKITTFKTLKHIINILAIIIVILNVLLSIFIVFLLFISIIAEIIFGLFP